MHRKTWLTSLFGIFALLIISGCSPEIGSADWCVTMKEKPKGDWTANEAGEYAKHCLL